MRLLDILRLPEGKTLEFIRDLSSPEGALRSITAFANTAGGTVILGVEDGRHFYTSHPPTCPSTTSSFKSSDSNQFHAGADNWGYCD